MTPSSSYDAIVIGSGFGGSITAMRLAEAGRSVLVLERGRHWKPGEFPRNIEDVDAILWRYPKHAGSRGLYDVRFFSGLAAVAASGVGGGSLIYANIHYRPQAAVFDDPRWPSTFTLESLEPYYRKVEDNLGVAPVPHHLDLPKRDVFRRAAAAMGREVFDTPQAVSWEDPGVPGRGACQLVAECEFGCQYGAKNTLDFTYLGRAQKLGAAVWADKMVTHISPGTTGSGWQVHFTDTVDGSVSSAEASRVVLAAGTLGTNELLLRSRDVTRTLPNLPARLGVGYSGNGDFLGSIQNSATDLAPWKGPDVTSVMWYFDSSPGFALAAPTFNEPVMRVLAAMGQPPVRAWVKRLAPVLWKLLPSALPWALRKGLLSKPRKRPGPNAGPAERMTNVFAIGQDNANGRMLLDDGNLDIHWDYLNENRELVRRQEAAMQELAGQYGGTYAAIDSWNIFNKIATVHNLGGCHISEDPSRGVVDVNGQVWGHPGLYVADGSIIPTSIGSHPVMTISAMAEWIAEQLVAGYK